MINPAQLLGLQLPPGVQIRRQTYRVVAPALPALLLPYEPNRIVAYVVVYNVGIRPTVGSRDAVANGGGLGMYYYPVLPIFGADELWTWDSGLGALDISAMDHVAVPDALR